MAEDGSDEQQLLIQRIVSAAGDADDCLQCCCHYDAEHDVVHDDGCRD